MCTLRIAHNPFTTHLHPAWIELPLIVNNRFLPLFYELLSSEDLREEVCECLYEVP